MKNYTQLLLVFIAVSQSVNADANTFCLRQDGAIQSQMRSVMINDLGVDAKSLDDKKTRLELLSESKVSRVLAEQFAKKDLDKDKAKSDIFNLTWNDYLTTYTDDNVINLIIKYTFENKIGKKNVFIGSAIINDNECTVNTEGYVTVSREF